jgi:predicted site-specific integrase-resolvase
MSDSQTGIRDSKIEEVLFQRQEPAKMFGAGLYARVSTDDQKTIRR